MMMNKTVGKKSKKANSYWKIFLWMLIGGVIGGIAGLCSSMFLEDGVRSLLEVISMGIANHMVAIMAGLTVTGLLICILCHWKCERLIRESEHLEDDEAQDLLDWKFEVWSGIGATGSNVILILSMTVFPFITLSSKSLTDLAWWWIIGLFLASGAICTIYQVAMVKQMLRKDPTKKGDVTGRHFQKEWLESCDEAEKAMVYRSSYRTFQFLRGFLMALFLIALMAQVLVGSGLAAVVFLGIAYGGMMIAYSVHCLKIQKEDLSK